MAVVGYCDLTGGDALFGHDQVDATLVEVRGELGRVPDRNGRAGRVITVG